MSIFFNTKDKKAIFLGIIYSLVALGFYFTPFMIFILGLASFSTIAALQTVLFQSFRWHFLLLGVLFVFLTSLFYLRHKELKTLVIADIKSHWAYLGVLIISFISSYLVLFWLAIFVLTATFN